MGARRGTITAALLLFAFVASARADGPPAKTGATIFDLKDGKLTYRLVHKLHEVNGVSQALEGKAKLAADGTAQVQVRAKVASFDSGNSNRDVHMRGVTHEAQHPYVSVRGTLAGLSLPLAGPATVTLHATIEMNGEKQQAEIPITLDSANGGLHAKFTFPISLDALKVDRPELLFVKVDDAVNIDGDLTFAAAGEASAAKSEAAKSEATKSEAKSEAGH
jgi:hypothetical protein